MRLCLSLAFLFVVIAVILRSCVHHGSYRREHDVFNAVVVALSVIVVVVIVVVVASVCVVSAVE